ncbi:MAG: DnaJ domain-containing protein [Spirochaetes bacterium]|nr:DnaJ domain-containing protein [Spirochaetota bacterium]
MGKYEEITHARNVLGIGEYENLNNIKKKFKKLIKQYHPDICLDDKEKCRKKAEDIIASYKLINDYCSNYRFSFKKEEVMKYLSVEELWKEQFGNDPIWSNNFDKNKDM